jgi:DNA-binding IclR family transcriptional regulator
VRLREQTQVIGPPVPKDSETGEHTARKLDTTLVKGFAVLNALALADAPLGISALSEQLGIGKSNVHRLLTTMAELGYVQRESATRQYSPTLKLWELGTAVARRNLLIRAAKPVMQALHEDTGESVYMSMLLGTEILYLEKIESTRGAKSPSRIGLRVPALATASGKVLLADQPNSRALVISAMRNVPADANISAESIMAEFDEIRLNGYALSDSGWIRGVNALAVAVPNSGQPAVAAIGISVMPDRYSLLQLKKLAPKLFNSAAQIAATSGPAQGK